MGLMNLFSSQPASPGAAAPPQGLLDLLLGQNNPLSQFADSRQNVLGAIGAGLASGPTFAQGMANAAQNVPQARKADYQMGLYRGQVSQTIKYLRDSGADDIAKMVEAGTISPADGFNMKYQRDNQQGVALAPGSSLVNPRTGKEMAGPSTGNGFTSQDLKSQSWNIVMKAQSDPSLKNTPQFQSAWAIVTEPTMTPQGMMMPNIPPGWGPDASAAAPAAGAAPPATSQGGGAGYAAPAGGVSPTSAAVGQDMPMVAQAANVQQGPGVIPGTQPFQETQQRTGFLVSSATPDLKRVVDGFPALMNFKDQALGMLPGDLGRAMQSPAYKQAKDAMSNSMVDLLYFASGANINKDEWQRKTEAYVPSPLDDPQTAVNKLDRFANDVISLANASKDPEKIKWAQKAIEGLPAMEQQILNPPKAAAPQAASGPPAPAGNGPVYIVKPGTGERMVLQNGQWVPAT